MVQIGLVLAGLLVSVVVLKLRGSHKIDPRSETDLAIPLRRFARSVVALITGGEDYGYLPARDNRSLLGQSWDIHGAPGVHATLSNLTQPVADPVAAAWNLVRAIHVARMAAGAGYLDEAASWQWVAYAAAGLQARFSDWRSLADAFAQGRLSWATAAGLDVTAMTRQTQTNIAHAQSMWRLMPFSTPLA